MTPVEFLHRVWPSRGHYVIATPFTIPGTDHQTYAQRVFDSVDAAAEYVRTASQHHDVFYGLHSLREPKVWNPHKTNPRTGEMGAYEKRVQRNMLECRVFFFDLDVDPDDTSKFKSQSEAIRDLRAFAQAVELPKPLITSSGGGLHVYWVLEQALPTPEWKKVAAKLRRLAKHHQLKVDPSRTTDTASVLRVAGTRNLKDQANPRPVKVLSEGVDTPTATFTDLIDRAAAGLEPDQVELGERPDVVADLGVESNLTRTHDDQPVKMTALITACQQVQRLARLKGDVSEPEWYHSLNLLRFVTDSHKVSHKISSGHPNYSPEETDAKIAQLKAQAIGPTTCEKLAEVCGAELCAGCPHAGQVKSPIVAARYHDTATAPVAERPAGTHTETQALPDPPPPYVRLRNGGVAIVSKNEDGIEEHTLIYENDLYPVSRIANHGHQTEQQEWCVHLPRVGQTYFRIEADALYDRRKFTSSVAHAGIYVGSKMIGGLQEYMIAYIRELQRKADIETQYDHLGWNSELTRFVLPDGALERDGSITPVTISDTASGAAETVHRRGTLDRQIELMDFYNHDAYIINQFMIVAALVAPIFHATGQYGSILNASGTSGAHKSTTLYTGASLWGHPSLFSLNGTNSGATTLGLQQRVATLANLPVCVDEITNMPVHRAQDMAMGVTQPNHRIRLTKTGREQHSITDTYKSTLMLCTANSSLHGILSSDNTSGTAGSMRVFEIEFQPTRVHTQAEADEFIREMRENYGHIGPAFMQHVIKNREKIEERIHAKMREINETARTNTAERFWTGIIAAVSVGATEARQLGLLSFDAEQLERWAIDHQIPWMRGVVHEEYANPLTVLTDFIGQNSSRIAVTDVIDAGGRNNTYMVREPRGDMIGHFNRAAGTLTLHRTAFKNHCMKIGANSKQIIDDLARGEIDQTGTVRRVVATKQIRQTMASGTDYATAQTRCFVVNMDHPDIAGTTQMSVIDGGAAPATAASEGQ
jgi:hypothetical protein